MTAKKTAKKTAAPKTYKTLSALVTAKKASVTTCQCSPGAQWPKAKVASTMCKLFWCKGCKDWRPWCEGGAPDERCATCVAADRRAA